MISMDSAGTLQMSIAESSDGCRIAYWSGGNRAGLPIVLLHGFSLDHSVWNGMDCARFLTALKEVVESGDFVKGVAPVKVPVAAA